MNRLALLLAVAVLSGCPVGGPEADAGNKPDAGPSTDGGGPMPSAKVRIHFHRALSDYDGWTVAVAAGATPASAASTGTDGFGALYEVTLDDGATTLDFSLKNGASTDASGALSAQLGTAREVWVISGLAKALTRTPPALPTATQVALYYQRPNGDYAGFGLHTWGSLVTETQWLAPLQPKGIDPDLGAGFEVPLASGTAGNCPANRICVIMHKGDEKDPGPDMTWDRATLGDLVFLTSGSATLTTTPRKPGSVDLTGASAHLLSRDTVAWNLTDASAASFELRWSLAADISVGAMGVMGGQAIALEPAASLPAALAAKAPHLASFRVFKVAAAGLGNVAPALKGQLIAIARKADGTLLSATNVQTAFALDDLFATTEALGPTFESVAGTPTVNLWAPTAQSAKLHVVDDAKAELPGSPFTLTANDKGVWSIPGQAAWYGKYYRFELRLFHPVTGKLETVTVTDPYSTSLSTNSKYSQFIDLRDPALAPAGWSTLAKPAFAGPQDTVLYEGHVRDFSVLDTTVPLANRGKYLGFTASTSDGMKHLSALAAAGLTHLHLLPAFDIATVDEDPANRVDLDATMAVACAKVTGIPAALCTSQPTKTVREVMASLPAASEDQQAIATALRLVDSFNWGYDPFHYGVPEGSYASTAEGTARILEFRRMVQALSQAGLRVVMDVVYNHTNSSGLSATSVLDKVVPGYYHRLNENSGNVETSTCCANTATEHLMMQRLMVDTLVRWARDYKVDGFRFDLMGHHLKQNIVDAKTALGALTLAADGVDGSKLVLYGEGWDFGEVANNARGSNATQRNMAGTGVGTFNDRLRDGVRGGSAFDSKSDLRKRQGFATGLFLDPNEATGTSVMERETLDKYNTFVRIGMAGNLAAFRTNIAEGATVDGSAYGYGGAPTGYNASPTEAINYVSAHDNQTLWDIAQYKLPTGTPSSERARAHVVALSTVVLGQGIPFIHMGDDLLRSKSMERDSYDSGDWFNRIDWTGATNGWRSGLPNAGKDSGNWPWITPIFADASTTPSAADIGQARARFQELLKVRKSTPLLHLPSAAEVMKRVDFPTGGATQVRGLLVMTVTDGTCAGADLDPTREAVVVLINAGKASASWPNSGATGFTLHPIDGASADPLARTATFTGGTFTVPARSVAVFEKLQSGAQGAGVPCNTR